MEACKTIGLLTLLFLKFKLPAVTHELQIWLKMVVMREVHFQLVLALPHIAFGYIVSVLLRSAYV